jgi:murein DD-endopeptidase MepM/ murein hydrolase activator NlpD
VLAAVGLLVPVTTAGPVVRSARVALTAPVAVPPGVAAYRPPLDGPLRIARGFDPPARPWLPGHRGVDLAAVPGAVVRAAGNGVVRFAGPLAGRGVVSVEHAGGLRTTYEPVAVRVRPGDRVAAGHPLGAVAVGHRGCAAPACLHWGLRRDAVHLDPFALLGLARTRLLPLDAPRGSPAPLRGAVSP